MWPIHARAVADLSAKNYGASVTSQKDIAFCGTGFAFSCGASSSDRSGRLSKHARK